MSVDLAQTSAAPTTPTGATVTTVAAAGNPGSAAPVTAVPGVAISGSAPASEKTTETATANPWLSSLSEENRKLAETKQWKTPDDPMKSYAELQKAFSSKIEDLAPKAVAEYEFKAPDNAADIGYDGKFADQFKSWALANKLSKEQASGIHDAFVQFAASSVEAGGQASAQAVEAKLTAAETALTSKWGAKDGPTFTRSVELARRAIDQLGIGKELAAAGVIVDGKVANAALIEALSKVGQGMYAEDSTFGQATNASNPFDPKTLNATAQGKIFQSDPQKAKLLIMALPEADRARYSYLLSRVK